MGSILILKSSNHWAEVFIHYVGACPFGDSNKGNHKGEEQLRSKRILYYCNIFLEKSY